MVDVTQQPLPDRLRGYAKDESGWHCIDATCEEAADRIEALEAALRDALEGYEECLHYKSAYLVEKHGDRAEVERLRAALKD